jgi:cytosine deaminase
MDTSAPQHADGGGALTVKPRLLHEPLVQHGQWRHSMSLHVAQMTNQAAMQQCSDAVTKNPARILHLDGYGLEKGCNADMVLLQAQNLIEALRLKVWRRGAWVAQTPARTAALNLPSRPAQTSFLHTK